MEKNSKCPKCGSNNIVPIVYGMPSYEFLEKEGVQEVLLGGCIVNDSSPIWHCKDCQNYWGNYSDRLESERQEMEKRRHE
ncbi:MAG: hypothetical protein AMQ22_00809 [Candidatus Methanofastidiosum methylothiophilum]|uniref:Uncharacterized protein n=1 Tax=Candidatus Methanofastidiosum methylothiophilum TaxID=1705564 RepID=A0A150J5H0_9EURY|nr:MAG: hypothetical protein AMQ22_00809 [Candidatus Methanofastidiosum methylthiophilus]